MQNLAKTEINMNSQQHPIVNPTWNSRSSRLSKNVAPWLRWQWL